MQPLKIRRAAEHDAAALTALIQESSAYQGTYATVISGYRVTPAYIGRNLVFCAVDSRGELLGFYSLVLDLAELDLAFVSDAAQGMGVGRVLMEHMLDQADQAGLTQVRVVSNPPAEQFYRRMGAERVGTVPASPPKVTWVRPELRFIVPRPADVTGVR